MKLRARDVLKGKIVEVVDELKLKKGQSAYAVIKASDVMAAIDD